MIGSNKLKTACGKTSRLLPATFVQCAPRADVDGSGNPIIADNCTLDHLLAVPVEFFNWLMLMAGLIALGVMVWGGIRMLISFTADSPEVELNNAKLTIRRGIAGLIIIAFSYLIVWILVYTIFGLMPGSTIGQALIKFGLPFGLVL